MQKNDDNWVPCREIHGYIINDKTLWDVNRHILVTYETPSGKRIVKEIWSQRGKVMKPLNGEIIAWREMPGPYTGGRINETTK